MLKKDVKYKIDLSKTIYKDIPNDLIPEIVPWEKHYEFKGYHTCVVNAIRRVIIDEMPFSVMSFDEMETDDEYILPEIIKMNLAMMPVKNMDNIIYGGADSNNKKESKKEVNKKEVNKKENNIMLKLINTTNDDMDILGKHIYVNGKSVKYSNHFNSTYKIGILRPGKTIVIKDIFLEEGYGYDNGIFQGPTLTLYDALDFDHNKTGADQEPMHHMLGFVTNDGSDPILLYKKAINIIIDKVNNVNKLLVGKGLKSFQNNELKFEPFVDGDLSKYTFYNESHSLANLLTTYIYKKYPDMELVNYMADHPLKHEFTLNVMTLDPHQKIINACNDILKTFENLKKMF